MRRVPRRMRTSVHVNRPIQRTHELNMVGFHVSREWILLFENASAAKAAPLMRRRVRTALVLGSAPDGFGAGVRAHSSCVIEWNPQIVPERRLAKTDFVNLMPPFASAVRRILW